jgi:succinoglycan biosynthesis transport protein ExoP
MSAPSSSAPDYADLRLDKRAGDPLRDITIDFNRIGGFLRDRARLILLCVLLGALIGFGLSLVQTKQYTAASRVLYGTLKGQGPDEQTTLDTGLGDISVEAQIELIRSDAILRSVIATLDLDADPAARAEFARQSSLGRLFGRPAKPADPAALADAISRKLAIERVGRSQILEIRYTSADPVLSAKIANAFANAYVDEQRNANAELARSTSEWLTQQIADLRAQSTAKDQQIQRFRTEHSLVGADGQSVGTQQLAELNVQLVSAQSDLAKAEARHDRVVAMARTDLAGALPELAGNASIAALQTQYLATQQRYIHLQGRLGNSHRLVQNLARDLANLRRALAEEAGRAAASTQNEVAIDTARVATLEANLATLVGMIGASDAASGQLAQMQAESDALRKSYQSSLDRYQQALQSQSYPVAGTRVITTAEPPSEPASASRLRIILIGAGFGLLGGILLGLIAGWTRPRPIEVAAP